MVNRFFIFPFLIVLCFFFFLFLFSPDKELSYSERRKLAQIPDFNASFMTEFESYASDQFPFREQFRRVKTLFNREILKKSDDNGVFTVDGGFYKIDYPLNESSINYLSDRINYVREKYSPDAYLSIIPDKNYYLRDEGYLIIDYKELEGKVREKVDARYIDLFPVLSAESYYKTDPHWKQETLAGVVSALAEGMGAELSIAQYEPISFYPFYGAYSGQSALASKPDTLVYLVNAETENIIVESMEKPEAELKVYNERELGGMDSFNVFLNGPEAIITLRNPVKTFDRELIIFRDSFASPLAPLLLDMYDSITLIDLRYISPAILENHVDFKSQDVLFLYSALLFNNSAVVK